MVKNLLLLLLVSMLMVSNSLNVSAAKFATNETEKPDLCDAPPPDSFRVTDISSGVVTLAWVPAWAGANHTIVLSVQDSSGAWSDLVTYYSVPGESYSFTILIPGSYKITNATNCTSGEVSFRYSEVRLKIIELATAGRTPLNPVSVHDCSSIDYLNHVWVGFKVQEIATGRSNLFEVQVVGVDALIRRVANNGIVAVDGSGLFPIGSQRLTVGASFQIDDKNKPFNQQAIGFVRITQDFSGPFPTIGLCKDPDSPVHWKPTYEFTALTAESIAITVPSGGGGQGFAHSPVTGLFKAQSPFTNSLLIFSPESLLESDETTVILFGANEQLIFKQNFTMLTQQIALPTESLLPGVYFLQIWSNHCFQSIKVVKPI